MGHRPKRFKLFTETNLEALVPSDNFYRRLERCLELSFVRDLVRGCYEEVRRPSIDPVVFFKLQLIAFFEGITSERRLMETAELNLAHRWYLGYDLDEPLPDHSSLSKVRSRYGLEAFHRFFEQVVELCIEAGLVEGEELYLDATKVAANASTHTLHTRLSVVAAREHVQKIFGENPTSDEPAQPQLLSETPSVSHPTSRRAPRLVEATEPEPKSEPRPSSFVSLKENIKGLEDDGGRAFVPLPDFSQRTGYLPAEAFIYDAENDSYICPQGQELRLRVRRYSESDLIYQAKASVCNYCPIKSRCTASSNGRQVFRSFFQSYLDKVKGYRQLPAYKRALRKRKVWLEPLFAEAKVLHGLRRFRLRGLHEVNTEGLMVAAG